MAGVKTERTTAGHKTQPKRPKDWVAAPKVIRVSLPKGYIPTPFTAAIPAKQPRTPDEQSAVAAYDAACKALASCKPNDRGAEGRRAVAYQKLVQLGLRPQVRGTYRA